MGNSGGAITHEMEVNMFYKEHVERVRIDVYKLGKTDVVMNHQIPLRQCLYFFSFNYVITSD